MRIEVEGKGAYERRLTAPGDPKVIAWMKGLRTIIISCGTPALILILPVGILRSKYDVAFKAHAMAYATRLETAGILLMLACMFLGGLALLASALLLHESRKSAIRRGS